MLVCDDTESIRRLVRINLELDGFEVIEACHGGDAVDLLYRCADSGELPKAIVLDADMAPLDGWWALDAIRRCPILSGVPVVMATAAVDGEDRSAMHARGEDASVRKPFDPDEIGYLVDGFAREGRSFTPRDR